jgi:hypothetical protein
MCATNAGVPQLVRTSECVQCKHQARSFLGPKWRICAQKADRLAIYTCCKVGRRRYIEGRISGCIPPMMVPERIHGLAVYQARLHIGFALPRGKREAPIPVRTWSKRIHQHLYVSSSGVANPSYGHVGRLSYGYLLLSLRRYRLNSQEGPRLDFPFITSPLCPQKENVYARVSTDDQSTPCNSQP